MRDSAHKQRITLIDGLCGLVRLMIVFIFSLSST